MGVEVCWGLEVQCKCRELWLQDADIRAWGEWARGEPQRDAWGSPGVSTCPYQVPGIWSFQLGSVLQEVGDLPGTPEGCRWRCPVLAQVTDFVGLLWPSRPCFLLHTCAGHLGSCWAVPSTLVRSSSGRSVGSLGLFQIHPRRGRPWEPYGLSPEFLLCHSVSSYLRTAN